MNYKERTVNSILKLAIENVAASTLNYSSNLSQSVDKVVEGTNKVVSKSDGEIKERILDIDSSQKLNGYISSSSFSVADSRLRTPTTNKSYNSDNNTEKDILSYSNSFLFSLSSKSTSVDDRQNDLLQNIEDNLTVDDAAIKLSDTSVEVCMENNMECLDMNIDMNRAIEDSNGIIGDVVHVTSYTNDDQQQKQTLNSNEKIDQGVPIKGISNVDNTDKPSTLKILVKDDLDNNIDNKAAGDDQVESCMHKNQEWDVAIQQSAIEQSMCNGAVENIHNDDNVENTKHEILIDTEQRLSIEKEGTGHALVDENTLDNINGMRMAVSGTVASPVDEEIHPTVEPNDQNNLNIKLEVDHIPEKDIDLSQRGDGPLQLEVEHPVVTELIQLPVHDNTEARDIKEDFESSEDMIHQHHDGNQISIIDIPQSAHPNDVLEPNEQGENNNFRSNAIIVSQPGNGLLEEEADFTNDNFIANDVVLIESNDYGKPELITKSKLVDSLENKEYPNEKQEFDNASTAYENRDQNVVFVEDSMKNLLFEEVTNDQDPINNVAKLKDENVAPLTSDISISDPMSTVIEVYETVNRNHPEGNVTDVVTTVNMSEVVTHDKANQFKTEVLIKSEPWLQEVSSPQIVQVINPDVRNGAEVEYSESSAIPIVHTDTMFLEDMDNESVDELAFASNLVHLLVERSMKEHLLEVAKNIPNLVGKADNPTSEIGIIMYTPQVTATEVFTQGELSTENVVNSLADITSVEKVENPPVEVDNIQETSQVIDTLQVVDSTAVDEWRIQGEELNAKNVINIPANSLVVKEVEYPPVEIDNVKNASRVVELPQVTDSKAADELSLQNRESNVEENLPAEIDIAKDAPQTIDYTTAGEMCIQGEDSKVEIVHKGQWLEHDEADQAIYLDDFIEPLDYAAESFDTDMDMDMLLVAMSGDVDTGSEKEEGKVDLEAKPTQPDLLKQETTDNDGKIGDQEEFIEPLDFFAESLDSNMKMDVFLDAAMNGDDGSSKAKEEDAVEQQIKEKETSEEIYNMDFEQTTAVEMQNQCEDVEIELQKEDVNLVQGVDVSQQLQQEHLNTECNNQLETDPVGQTSNNEGTLPDVNASKTSQEDYLDYPYQSNDDNPVPNYYNSENYEYENQPLFETESNQINFPYDMNADAAYQDYNPAQENPQPYDNSNGYYTYDANNVPYYNYYDEQGNLLSYPYYDSNDPSANYNQDHNMEYDPNGYYTENYLQDEFESQEITNSVQNQDDFEEYQRAMEADFNMFNQASNCPEIAKPVVTLEYNEEGFTYIRASEDNQDNQANQVIAFLEARSDEDINLREWYPMDITSNEYLHDVNTFIVDSIMYEYNFDNEEILPISHSDNHVKSQDIENNKYVNDFEVRTASDEVLVGTVPEIEHQETIHSKYFEYNDAVEEPFYDVEEDPVLLPWSEESVKQHNPFLPSRSLSDPNLQLKQSSIDGMEATMDIIDNAMEFHDAVHELYDLSDDGISCHELHEENPPFENNQTDFVDEPINNLKVGHDEKEANPASALEPNLEQALTDIEIQDDIEFFELDSVSKQDGEDNENEAPCLVVSQLSAVDKDEVVFGTDIINLEPVPISPLIIADEAVLNDDKNISDGKELTVAPVQQTTVEHIEKTVDPEEPVVVEYIAKTAELLFTTSPFASAKNMALNVNLSPSQSSNGRMARSLSDLSGVDHFHHSGIKSLSESFDHNISKRYLHDDESCSVHSSEHLIVNHNSYFQSYIQAWEKKLEEFCRLYDSLVAFKNDLEDLESFLVKKALLYDLPNVTPVQFGLTTHVKRQDIVTIDQAICALSDQRLKENGLSTTNDHTHNATAEYALSGEGSYWTEIKSIAQAIPVDDILWKVFGSQYTSDDALNSAITLQDRGHEMNLTEKLDWKLMKHFQMLEMTEKMSDVESVQPHESKEENVAEDLPEEQLQPIPTIAKDDTVDIKPLREKRELFRRGHYVEDDESSEEREGPERHYRVHKILVDSYMTTTTSTVRDSNDPLETDKKVVKMKPILRSMSSKSSNIRLAKARRRSITPQSQILDPPSLFSPSNSGILMKPYGLELPSQMLSSSILSNQRKKRDLNKSINKLNHHISTLSAASFISTSNAVIHDDHVTAEQLIRKLRRKDRNNFHKSRYGFAHPDPHPVDQTMSRVPDDIQNNEIKSFDENTKDLLHRLFHNNDVRHLNLPRSVELSHTSSTPNLTVSSNVLHLSRERDGMIRLKTPQRIYNDPITRKETETDMKPSDSHEETLQTNTDDNEQDDIPIDNSPSFDPNDKELRPQPVVKNGKILKLSTELPVANAKVKTFIRPRSAIESIRWIGYGSSSGYDEQVNLWAIKVVRFLKECGSFLELKKKLSALHRANTRSLTTSEAIIALADCNGLIGNVVQKLSSSSDHGGPFYFGEIKFACKLMIVQDVVLAIYRDEPRENIENLFVGYESIPPISYFEPTALPAVVSKIASEEELSPPVVLDKPVKKVRPTTSTQYKSTTNLNKNRPTSHKMKSSVSEQIPMMSKSSTSLIPFSVISSKSTEKGC